MNSTARQADITFIVIWTLATVVGFLTLASSSGTFFMIFAALWSGLLMGWGQWFVLRRRANVTLWWYVLTAISRGISLLISLIVTISLALIFSATRNYSLSNADVIDNGLIYVVIAGALDGLVIGAFQAVLLNRSQVNKASLWPVLLALIWSLGRLVSWAAIPSSDYVWSNPLSGLIAGLLSATMILWLLKQSPVKQLA